MSRLFSALGTRNYRVFFLGGLVSNTGTWVQRVGQDWLVLQLTDGSGTALGVTTALQFLPMPLFGLWAGTLADRYPKRRVIAASSTAMGLVALVLGLLVVTGTVQVWHVFVLAFLLGTGAAIENPTRQAFVVEMVGRRDLTNAVGLNSASFNVARVVGPASAGLLIAALGDATGPLFLLNAASYGAVLLALRAMRPEELDPAPTVPRGAGQVREGLRYVADRPDLVLVLLIVFFLGTFGLNSQITNALMATQEFGRGPEEYGLLGSVMAVGSLAGALLAARRRAPSLVLLVGGAVVFALLQVVSALMPTFWLFAASLVPVGMVTLTVITTANATMQLGVDPVVRGRVMALYMVVFFGGTPLGSPLIGALAEVVGARAGLVLGGVAVLLGVLGSLLVVARRPGVRVRAQLGRRPTLTVEAVPVGAARR